MNHKQPRIGIVVSSTRPSRICRQIAEWFYTIVSEEKQLSFSFIDLLEINLPFLDEPNIPASGLYEYQHTKDWSELITSYTGFVFVFPQYNWGYPAPLKNALDFLYTEWAEKPVSLVTYGRHGGSKAALQMQQILKGLHMRNTHTNLEISINETMFNEAGQFKHIQTDLASYKATAHSMTNELSALLL
jgi:NAD(P)H-dependent FMN reductase